MTRAATAQWISKKAKIVGLFTLYIIDIICVRSVWLGAAVTGCVTKVERGEGRRGGGTKDTGILSRTPIAGQCEIEPDLASGFGLVSQL